MGNLLIAVDPGSSASGAAAWGAGDWPSAAMAWTWRKSEVVITDPGGEWVADCDRDLAEAEIVSWWPVGASLLVEGLFVPSGYSRRNLSVGSTLPLAEHVGRLIQAYRSRSRVREVARPTSDEWRPVVGIPARTQRDRAEALAVDIATRAGWRIRGAKAAQGAIAEAICMYRAARIGPKEGLK